MATFVQRMVGAAKLNAATYEEVEQDASATRQAIGVVALSSVAAGIGLGAGVWGLVAGTLIALLGWYVWAWLTHWIGTRLLPEPQTRSDRGELLRTIGFASAPGILRVLGVIPVLQAPVFAVTAIWTLVAVVVGVRQALDYQSTGRAIGVCVVGWLVQWVVFAVLALVVGIRPAA
jgi:Yip1 domain